MHAWAWSEFQKSSPAECLFSVPSSHDFFLYFCFDGWFIFPLGYFRASPGHSSSQYHFQSSAKSGIIWDYSGAPLCINVCDLTSQTPSGSEAQMSRGCSDRDEMSCFQILRQSASGDGGSGVSASQLWTSFEIEPNKVADWINNCIHTVSILQTCQPNLQSSWESRINNL